MNPYCSSLTMAEVVPVVPSYASPTKQPPKITSIKILAESPDLITIPASYTFTPNSHDLVVSDTEGAIPVIDYSLLISSSPDHRSKIIHDLGKACQEWGFFMVINHGVPEKLMRSMIDACKGFFDLSEEEKQEYTGSHVLDPIRCGTSFNTSVEKVFCWRDFLKVFVHPVFHSPSKPVGLSDTMLEYSKRVKEVTRELLKGISESLGLEADYIENALNFERGLQISIANYYPPCTEPELAMGLPCHSDHGLLTLLIENGVSGLQVQHKGKWVNLNSIPNSFLVNTGDHLEILSNGKFKSILHRAVVNKNNTRISIAMAHGPSLDTVVSPAPELLDRESKAPAYIGIKYEEYVNLQQSNKLDGKSCLDRVRI
ncbi:2-oxoglutarate-dependent dioxygenase 19 [Ricinus communis]|uniref:2-oxoglutarate-dependent dioxygenase 19 n=1 Tax=Ricinus communis TaxID=3988 RepID=UPI00201A9D94|nr:2-oxoglutarate-dependent dioxygenase 19 [Ricinus communis]